MTTHDTKDCCQKARAEMALEAVEILHKLILNTYHVEAILLGEAAQKAILTAGVSDNEEKV